jgi:FKBP-type peptidyl-prolyl cis-trans isomerase
LDDPAAAGLGLHDPGAAGLALHDPAAAEPCQKQASGHVHAPAFMDAAVQVAKQMLEQPIAVAAKTQHALRTEKKEQEAINDKKKRATKNADDKKKQSIKSANEKMRKAIAVASTPSTMIDHHATAGTGAVGRCTHASGA